MDATSQTALLSGRDWLLWKLAHPVLRALLKDSEPDGTFHDCSMIAARVRSKEDESMLYHVVKRVRQIQLVMYRVSEF